MQMSMQMSMQDPYSYPQQRRTPGFGNTAGPLDQLSVQSFGGQNTLPMLNSQYLAPQQQQQQMMMMQQMMIQQQMQQQIQPGFGSNFASGSGSVHGGNQPQRVPTIPLRPATMPNTAYNNTISMSNTFNPNALMSNSMDRSYNGPFYGGSPDGANAAYGLDAQRSERSVTWGNSMAQAGGTSQPHTIFDRDLMTTDNARKLGLSFNIAIQEIDLIDLVSVHKLVKNSPFVSAACGKWTASTPVSNL
jgi:hypothetical protein